MKMKKCKILLSLVVMVFLLLLSNEAMAASDSSGKKLLYQDATINSDGSVTVKEALWLNGNYNGATRKIEFCDGNRYPFSGIYSNFSGDSDIYDASGITDVKVYDISQSNFSSINDINNIENEFENVSSASNGKYGLYTIKNYSRYSNVSIFCPSKKKKVLCLEYTIKDAVVVHNDVAELYWCFLDNTANEIIMDYKLMVHLPQEDENVMIWSHGTNSGYFNIDDYKTISLRDTNIQPREFETMRIMFNKELVPNATKISNVDGKGFIIKYENAMSDPNIANQETNRVKFENELSSAIINLNKNRTMYWYNKADNLLKQYTWNEEQKEKYEAELAESKEVVNQNWKEYIEESYENMLYDDDILQYKIDYLKKIVDQGFDLSVKEEYYEKINQLQQKLDKYNLSVKQNLVKNIAFAYCALGIICLLVLLKIIFERKRYHKKYYKDFPSEDNAYIVDYLMNKKINGKTFSVAILDLIAKKEILLEKSSTYENDFDLILSDKNFERTPAENKVIEIIFNLVGKNKRCSLEQLRQYGETSENATKIARKLNEFKKNVLKEADNKNYFKKDNILIKLLQKTPLILCVVGYFLGIFINNNGYINLWVYYILITILTYVYYKILKSDKRRTNKGQQEYSKWLAHKRFLKDFGNLEQKELSQLTESDRYIVTAAVFDCSDQLLEELKIHVNTSDKTSELLQGIALGYRKYREVKQVEDTVQWLMRKVGSENSIESPKTYSNKESSSSSSGSGSGGGSSSSGGHGGGGGGWSRF